MSEQQPDFAKKQAVALAFELGYIIAIPILAFGYLGKYLDAAWGTHPYLKVAGLLLAIISSSVWLYKKFSQVFESLKGKRPKKEENNNASNSTSRR